MLNISIGGIMCRVSLLFPAVLIVILYHDPTGVVLSGIAAAVIHEAGHLSAFVIFRHRPQEIVFSVYGMKMIPPKGRVLHPIQMIAVLFAGIAVNVICGIVAWVCCANVSFSFVHIALAALNALPVVPLDGGQIVYIALRCVFDEKTARIVQRVGELAAIGIILVIGSVVLYYTRYNFTFLLVAFYVILCKLFDKFN